MRSRGMLAFTCYVVFFAWLDWIIHRSVVFIVVVGAGLIAAAAFRTRIGAALTARLGSLVEAWQRVPARMRRLLIALTPLLYVLLRGQGSSGAGTVVLLAGLAVAAAVIFLGHVIDGPLRGFYAVRDRLLARWVRALLAPVLGVLIAFLVVHGSVRDLPALFGGTTTSPQMPVGISGRFFLATLLAGACTVLLLREGGRRA